MPIRVPLTWMGETPLSAKPRLASERMEPDSPILPVAAGSLPSSSPVREGHGEPVTGASQNLRGDAGALDGLPVDERVVRRLEAALEPPSRQGIAGLGATRGDGAGVCKATRSRTRSRPSDCRVAPSPAQTSAAAPATAVGRAQIIGAKRLSGLGRCARSGRRSVHCPPTSFAHAGTAMSVGTRGVRVLRKVRRPVRCARVLRRL